MATAKLLQQPNVADPMVVMGKVVGAYGVRGWVKIQPFTDYVDSLMDYGRWWHARDEQGRWTEVKVQQCQVHGKTLIAQLSDCPDRNEAERRKGSLIAVPRSSLPPAEEDEYYWSDLLGMQVINQQQQLLGVADDLLDTGANQVLVVKSADTNVLIPFIGDFIVRVDLAARQIQVDWQLDYSQ